MKIQVKWRVRWGVRGAEEMRACCRGENLKEREDVVDLGVDVLVIINGSQRVRWNVRGEEEMRACCRGENLKEGKTW